MGKKRAQTFAEIVRQDAMRRTDQADFELVPGEFNISRQLFDLEGGVLTRTKARVTVKQAMTIISSGAAAASESCGCGGWAGCQPEWLDQAELDSLLAAGKPVIRKSGSPTWIDVWTSETTTLVFAHGNIIWTSHFQ